VWHHLKKACHIATFMRNYPLFLALATLFAFNGSAQIQVSQEPRHHNVFENEWVRILDVHIPPHDTSLIHKHSTPSVFMVLSNTKTGSQVLIEPGKPSFADGNIWFEGFYDTPRIHRVWNEDTVEFHVIDMELLHKPSSTANESPAIPFSKELFNVKPVEAFRVTMPAGKSFTLPALGDPLVIVGLTGFTASGPTSSSPAAATVNDKPFTKKGDFLFLPANSSQLAISNKTGTAEAQFAVFILH
jgi:hypothetical protein